MHFLTLFCVGAYSSFAALAVWSWVNHFIITFQVSAVSDTRQMADCYTNQLHFPSLAWFSPDFSLQAFGVCLKFYNNCPLKKKKAMSLPNPVIENVLERLCEVGFGSLLWFWTQHHTLWAMLVCDPLCCPTWSLCNPSASAHNVSSVGVTRKSHHTQHNCLVMDIGAWIWCILILFIYSLNTS